MDGKMDEYAAEVATGGGNADRKLPPMTSAAQAEGAMEGVYIDHLLFSLAYASRTRPSTDLKNTRLSRA